MHGAPIARTSFVGRQREILALRRALKTTRILTLAGPAGCGKTRLAIELCRRERDREVAWVDLASASRAEEVLPRLQAALGLTGLQDQPDDALGAALRDRRALIVIDNCEHLLDAVAAVVERVLTATGVQVLTTTRQPLAAVGELVWRVDPLPVPDGIHDTDVGRCARFASVELFVERARFALPTFALDDATCADIAAICRAADGIPLALELAAARLRHTPLADVRRRVADLVDPSGDGQRSVDARQRTLGAAIDWSYKLLHPVERRVFARLAVFAGTFAATSAEAVVCGDDLTHDEVAGALASLVDKSLVLLADDRLRLLQSIREYAARHLRESGEHETVMARFATHFAQLVCSELRPERRDAGSAVRINAETTNIAAALPWLIARDPQSALEVLFRFARSRWTLALPIHLPVQLEWLAAALARYSVRDRSRGHGLLGFSTLVIQLQRGAQQARAAADEALAIAVETGDRELEARARRMSGDVAASQGDLRRALAEFDVALPMLLELRPGSASLLYSTIAVIHGMLGEFSAASDDLRNAHAEWDRDITPGTTLRFITFLCAADVAFRKGDLEGAASELRAAIVLRRIERAPQGPAVFDLFAHLEFVRGNVDRAMRLLGIADRSLAETGLRPGFLSMAGREWAPAAIDALGARAVVARAEGARLTEADSVSYALEERQSDRLSARERAVVELVAGGGTDKEIAARLALSERTVENYLQRVRSKLGLRTRAEVGRWYAQRAAANSEPGVLSRA